MLLSPHILSTDYIPRQLKVCIISAIFPSIYINTSKIKVYTQPWGKKFHASHTSRYQQIWKRHTSTNPKFLTAKHIMSTMHLITPINPDDNVPKRKIVKQREQTNTSKRMFSSCLIFPSVLPWLLPIDSFSSSTECSRWRVLFSSWDSLALRPSIAWSTLSVCLFIV